MSKLSIITSVVLGLYVMNIKLENRTLKRYQVLITDPYDLRLPLDFISPVCANWEILTYESESRPIINLISDKTDWVTIWSREKKGKQQ